jgi:hypothetical protein
MKFRVLLEDCGGLRSPEPAPQLTMSPGAAHLAVAGAEETLCCQPVTRFVPTAGTSPANDEIAWCWICQATAAP